jgi:hypothetical protein
MYLIAAFFASVFGSFFSFLLKRFTHRVAVGLTLTASLLTATMIFYVLVQSLINGIVSLVDNEYVLMAFWAVCPANASICISACFAADIAAFIYRHKIRLMTAIAGVS